MPSCQTPTHESSHKVDANMCGILLTARGIQVEQQQVVEQVDLLNTCATFTWMHTSSAPLQPIATSLDRFVKIMAMRLPSGACASASRPRFWRRGFAEHAETWAGQSGQRAGPGPCGCLPALPATQNVTSILLQIVLGPGVEVHIQGSLLQLRGTAPGTTPAKDGKGNVLVLNGGPERAILLCSF